MHVAAVSSEPNSAIKNSLNKGKRSISRANDPKIISPAAIYQTQGPGVIQEARRTSNNTKTKGINQVNRKVVNKTIEIDGELETLQVAMMSP